MANVADQPTAHVGVVLPLTPAAFDVVFTSTDAFGNAGELNAFVHSALGWPEQALPNKEQLAPGWARVRREGSPEVFYVVTSREDENPESLLREHLGKALMSLAERVTADAPERLRVWMPVMGTGAARIHPEKSLAATVESLVYLGTVLGEAETPTSLAVSLSLPRDDRVDPDVLTEEAKSLLGKAFAIVASAPGPDAPPAAPDGPAARVDHWILRSSADAIDPSTLQPGVAVDWPMAARPDGLEAGHHAYLWGSPVSASAAGGGGLYAYAEIVSPAKALGTDTDVICRLHVFATILPPFTDSDAGDNDALTVVLQRAAAGEPAVEIPPEVLDTLAAICDSRFQPPPARWVPRERATTEAGFHHDAPTTDDNLGYAELAYALATFLKDRERTGLPITIAIDGPWGSGKSSVMHMLREYLQPGVHEEERARAEARRKPSLWRIALSVERQLSRGIERAIGIEHGISAASLTAILRKLKSLASKVGGSLRRLIARIRGIELATPEAPAPPAGEREFETVYVNAWRYGTGTRLTASIVHRILESIAIRRGPDFLYDLGLQRINRTALAGTILRRLADQVVAVLILGVIVAGLVVFVQNDFDPKRPFEIVGNKGLAALGFLFFYGALTRFLKAPPQVDIAQCIEAPDYTSLMGAEHEVEQDFNRLLAYLDARDLHLALFIDDLDRCAPDQIKEVVEALNVFFGRAAHKQCVFVLGMHRDMVAANLELAYEKLSEVVERKLYLEDQRPFGRRFLEKIAQFVVHLPEPKDEAIDDYLQSLTATSAPGPEAEPARDRARQVSISLVLEEEALESASETNGPRSRAQAQILRARRKRQTETLHQAGFTEAEMADARKLHRERKARLAEAREFSERTPEARTVFDQVRFALAKNPRQYKRFFNALRFENFLAANRGGPRKGTAVSQLLPLAQQCAMMLEWPDIAAWVSRRDDRRRILEEDARAIEDGAPPEDRAPNDAMRRLVCREFAKNATLRRLVLLEPNEVQREVGRSTRVG